MAPSSPRNVPALHAAVEVLHDDLPVSFMLYATPVAAVDALNVEVLAVRHN